MTTSVAQEITPLSRNTQPYSHSVGNGHRVHRHQLPHANIYQTQGLHGPPNQAWNPEAEYHMNRVAGSLSSPSLISDLYVWATSEPRPRPSPVYCKCIPFLREMGLRIEGWYSTGQGIGYSCQAVSIRISAGGIWNWGDSERIHPIGSIRRDSWTNWLIG